MNTYKIPIPLLNDFVVLINTVQNNICNHFVVLLYYRKDFCTSKIFYSIEPMGLIAPTKIFIVNYMCV